MFGIWTALFYSLFFNCEGIVKVERDTYLEKVLGVHCVRLILLVKFAPTKLKVDVFLVKLKRNID